MQFLAVSIPITLIQENSAIMAVASPFLDLSNAVQKRAQGGGDQMRLREGDVISGFSRCEFNYGVIWQED